MAQHVVGKAILGEDVGLEILVIGQPVVGQLLWAEHQYGLVAQLVVLDDSQRSERFTQTHAIGEDAAVVGFQLVDQAGGCVALEVEQLVPDHCVLIASTVVG
ncbi:hypothetical protein D9M70_580690 [compost metagenome]